MKYFSWPRDDHGVDFSCTCMHMGFLVINVSKLCAACYDEESHKACEDQNQAKY